MQMVSERAWLSVYGIRGSRSDQFGSNCICLVNGYVATIWAWSATPSIGPASLAVFGDAPITSRSGWISREDVLRAADIYREAGLDVEYGPGKHGVGENLFLYVREPGGMRIELFSGGYMLHDPDIFPFEWKVSQGSLNSWNPNHAVPDGFLFERFHPSIQCQCGRYSSY